MKTRGILFRPDLLDRILAGAKTQTRRLSLPTWSRLRAGDRLYVKEKLMRQDADGHNSWAEYARDGRYVEPSPFRWRWQRDWLSPLHMPAEAARVFLTLTADVRVEPVGDITDADALAEGVEQLDASWFAFGGAPWPDARTAFLVRWHEMHGDGNPNVAVLTFELRPAAPAHAADAASPDEPARATGTGAP